MRCKSCDKQLSDYESVRKDTNGEFYDLCGRCLSVSFQALNDFNKDQFKWDVGVDKTEDIL